MTRINVIEPEHLTDQHLMAEYRELPMVNSSLVRSLRSKKGVDVTTLPKKYTLNKGHVSQFYDKGKWLNDRYLSLIAELNNRGYNINPEARSVDWTVFMDNGLYGDWTPDKDSYVVNSDRILYRISEKPYFYTLNKEKINVDKYSSLIKTKYYCNIIYRQRFT